jgi:hypothetical protein
MIWAAPLYYTVAGFAYVTVRVCDDDPLEALELYPL